MASVGRGFARFGFGGFRSGGLRLALRGAIRALAVIGHVEAAALEEDRRRVEDPAGSASAFGASLRGRGVESLAPLIPKRTVRASILVDGQRFGPPVKSDL
jgi:hypothetical protein